MAAGATYTPLATTTASGSVNTITFSSISGSYTDLVIIANGYANYGFADRTSWFMRVGNGSTDTGNNYSQTGLYGNGTSATSSRETNQSRCFVGVISEKNTTAIIQINNYANTTTYKTYLSRGNSLGSSATQDVAAVSGLWRSTSAINTITLYTGDGTNYGSTTTFTLYGIAAA